jgi:hypothetical protein
MINLIFVQTTGEIRSHVIKVHSTEDAIFTNQEY